MTNPSFAERGSTLYLVLVCLVATLGGLLFGYDTAVISGTIGFLQQHYQFAIVFGMVLVYFVNYFIAGLGDEARDVNNHGF